jgi:hypothetical protein
VDGLCSTYDTTLTTLLMELSGPAINLMLGQNGSQRPASEPSVATMPEQPSIAHTMLGLMLWLRIR